MKKQQFFNFLLNKFKLSLFSKKDYISLLIIGIFLAFLFYKFFSEGVYAFIAFVVSFLISCLTGNFVLNNFKYSDYFIVRFFQRIIIFIFTAILFSIFSYYLCSYFFNFSFINTVECSGNFNDNINNKLNEVLINESDSTNEVNSDTTGNKNLNDNNAGNKGKELVNIQSEIDENDEEYLKIKVKKQLVDNTLQTVKEIGKFALEKIAPNLGVGTAAGYATAAMIKATKALPPLQRGSAIAGTAFITAASTKAAIDITSGALKNSDLVIDITKSKHADPNVDNIPSPDDLFDINSPLESEGGIVLDEAPLEVLLTSIFTLNIFILFLVLSLLFLIFNRYILL